MKEREGWKEEVRDGRRCGYIVGLKKYVHAAAQLY